jgi:hypothetical protein
MKWIIDRGGDLAIRNADVLATEYETHCAENRLAEILPAPLIDSRP